MDDSPSSSPGVGTLGGSDGSSDDGTDTPDKVPDETPTTPAPDPTPTPASAMETELYERDCFTMTIPKGWTVMYEPYDAGNGMTRLILAVVDPADKNNRIFFVSALEPYFISNAAKNAWLPYFNSASFEWAPVIEGEASAKKVLEQWPSSYTMMQEQGTGIVKYFSNYNLKSVYSEDISESSTANNIISAVLAQVSIPEASEPYDMYFRNELELNAPPSGSGIDSSAKYYIGWGTMGVVINTSQSDACLETLVNCLASLDTSNLNKKYGDNTSRGFTNDFENTEEFLTK